MSDLQPAPATPSGQGQATVQPAKDTAANTSDAAFLEYAWEDGTKESFQTKEDALRYFREGTLRHRDYTKKTQEVAKQREAQTKREKELEQTAQEILARKAKIDPLDAYPFKRCSARVGQEDDRGIREASPRETDGSREMEEGPGNRCQA
jgi:hypothetical protein